MFRLFRKISENLLTVDLDFKLFMKTAKLINRYHTLECFENVLELHKKKYNIVVYY